MAGVVVVQQVGQVGLAALLADAVLPVVGEDVSLQVGPLRVALAAHQPHAPRLAVVVILRLRRAAET